MGFVMKRVNGSEALGPDLRELRERAGLTVEAAARLSKLTPAFIRALEAERWEDLPDPAYVERLLRSYVSRFGVNESYFLHKYREGLKRRDIEKNPADFLPRPIRLGAGSMLVAPRLLAAAGFFLFAGLLGGYVYLQARAMSTPPEIELQSPEDGLRLSGPVLRVSGKTAVGAAVRVNGVEAPVDQEGNFRLDINVPRGTTMVIVTSKRRHSRESTAVRRVIYDRELPEISRQ